MSNLRLTVPEPKIDLYEQGFAGVCKLGRAPDGEKLSDLVEKIAEPMVIALDAPWGAGKSVFLKCWVGAHTKENEGTATTVYFDAFKHDYIDDPLVSIVSALDERVAKLAPDTPAKSALRNGVEKAKKYAPAIGRAFVRVGLSVATAGAANHIENPADTLLDEAMKAGSDELGTATKDFWNAEHNRRTVMEAFRESLSTIATPERKLVIVVDELDRCRPDYALNLLEVIKHFFDVPNVHFVLGVNLRELGNSVKARYGAGVNAEKYLQKFVTIVMPLNENEPFKDLHWRQIKHFEYVAEQMGLRSETKRASIKDVLSLVRPSANLSLRDVEKIASLAIICPFPEHFGQGAKLLYASSLFLKICAPLTLDRLREQKASINELAEVFHFTEQPGLGSRGVVAQKIWKMALGEFDTGRANGPVPEHVYFGNEDPQDALQRVILQSIDVFELFRT